jgi:hypothetical protein
MSCPSQLYLTGILSPSLKAALDNDNIISTSFGDVGASVAQATTVDEKYQQYSD